MYRQSIQSYFKKDGFSSENPFIMICDCETTGFSEKMHDMISFSAKICDYNLDIKSEITVYAKPKQERWTEAASKFGHGFRLEEALAFPSPRKTAIQLLHFLKPFKVESNDPILFISHDTSGFDFRFLKSFFLGQLLHESYEKVFKDEYKLSTISMARRNGITDNKLNTWATRLNLELNHHEVKSDTDACFEVFKHILENTNVQSELEITQ